MNIIVGIGHKFVNDIHFIIRRLSDFEVSLLMSYDTLVGMKQAMTHWLFDYDNLVMSYDIFVI